MIPFTISLTNFILKLLSSMIILFIGRLIRHSLLTNNWVLFTTSLFVAIFGTLADLAVFPFAGNIRSAVVDFIAYTLIIWFFPILVYGSHMTATAAVISGLILGIFEITTHRFVLRLERLTKLAR